MTLGRTLQHNGHNNNLCKNGCGFFGNQESQGYCSSCYKTIAGADPSVKPLEMTVSDTDHPKPMAIELIKNMPETSSRNATPAQFCTNSERANTSVRSSSPGGIRCGICYKKLGVVEQEILCACGGNFCNFHRYTDRHDCSFDYQSDARSRLTKANPTVAGEKVRKI